MPYNTWSKNEVPHQNGPKIQNLLSILPNKMGSHIDKQEKVFKVGFKVGGNLLNRFWRPNKPIMNGEKICRKIFHK